jgi:Rps23 Pro-64 3,4-dihydroxylase Tpa1-like proline 4-hydroxylase
MVTLRGQSRAKDGRIHSDSKSKILTALIYLNEDWQADSGRLRLLRSPDDMEDYAVEVAPDRGTLLAFRCSDHAYHGYPAFVGERRSIQLNWVLDDGVKKRELSRHGFSAKLKALSPFAGRGR